MLNLDLAIRQRRWLLKSQREVAEHLGVTERTFNRWERGHATPSVRSLMRWAEAIDLPLSRLLTNDDPEPAEAVGNG